ncbi:MAG: hypothetical protein ACRD96_14070, partial [Bryobacteraceae bacterium]
MTILRWNDPDPAHIPLLREGGITVVLAEAPSDAFAGECVKAGIQVNRPGDLPLVDLAGITAAGAQDRVALGGGLWPGVRRPPNVAGRGDETASASVEPWVDSNGYWIAYLRALYPRRAALLACKLPESDRVVPF